MVKSSNRKNTCSPVFQSHWWFWCSRQGTGFRGLKSKVHIQFSFEWAAFDHIASSSVMGKDSLKRRDRSLNWYSSAPSGFADKWQIELRLYPHPQPQALSCSAATNPCSGAQLGSILCARAPSSIHCMKYTQYVYVGQTRLRILFLLRILYPKNAKSGRLEMEVTETASTIFRVLILKLPCQPKAGWRQTSAGKYLLHPVVKPNVRCGGSCLWLCACRAWHRPLLRWVLYYQHCCIELGDYGWHFQIDIKECCPAFLWNLVEVMGLTLLFPHLEKATNSLA